MKRAASVILALAFSLAALSGCRADIRDGVDATTPPADAVETVQQPSDPYTEVLDEPCKVMKSVTMDMDGYQQRNEYTYDENGHMTQLKNSSVGSDGSTSTNFIQTYSYREGLLTEKSLSYVGTGTANYSYSLAVDTTLATDDDGGVTVTERISESEIAANPKASGTATETVEKFGADGIQVSKSTTSSGGHSLNRYGKDGVLTSITGTSSAGYEYDMSFSASSTALVIRPNSSGSTFTYQLAYDSDGLLTSASLGGGYGSLTIEYTTVERPTKVVAANAKADVLNVVATMALD